MNDFAILTTPETAHGARLCACTVRDGILHDAINGTWRALTDDFGNTVGVSASAGWGRAHHYGYGFAYLSERLGYN
jgi:hypothetical protein